MAIIFSEEDLNDVKPPCVIQSFINHNAVLYKVFVVGDSYTVVERPSLKNFPSGPTGEDTDKQREMVGGGVQALLTAALTNLFRLHGICELANKRPHKRAL